MDTRAAAGQGDGFEAPLRRAAEAARKAGMPTFGSGLDRCVEEMAPVFELGAGSTALGRGRAVARHVAAKLETFEQRIGEIHGGSTRTDVRAGREALADRIRYDRLNALPAAFELAGLSTEVRTAEKVMRTLLDATEHGVVGEEYASPEAALEAGRAALGELEACAERVYGRDPKAGRQLKQLHEELAAMVQASLGQDENG